MDLGEFFVSMEIFERALNFKWEIVIMYGPADHRRSPAFLVELHQKISNSLLPVVVGGDFNLILSPNEKNNDRINLPRMQLFNDWIAELGLREIERTGARFTWTNHQGWGANLGRDLRERKWALLLAIQALDAHADTAGISPDEWMLRYDLEDQLSTIYTDEEAYWRLRGTQSWVLRGDANTAYFQAIANGRRRRNSIHYL
ncbi:hypothetical protein D1007_00107 [Hordeum vulgare]|nr:hypothetical protein D1007_00107 [Hordeum vulgare]